ncbi:ankyrin-1-like [Trichogramma pretiosum]|uniref:ankyrin-1-like n=1 Tax=Trichogramma pretiosum TaxID=7493 RepID=UPI000C719266|nr:ankyrin-1-like [Trichogramma pretiosum]
MVHQTACAKIVDEEADESPRELANQQRLEAQEIDSAEGSNNIVGDADITGIGGVHRSKQAGAAPTTQQQQRSDTLPRISNVVPELDLVNARDHQGRSPLYLAAQSRDLDNVRLLLEHGADPKIRTADGSSVLLGVFDESLLDSIQQKEGKDEACRRVLLQLLDAGAPMNSVDSRGRNVLHLAAELKLEESLKLLLDRRGSELDLEAKDHEGRTALHVAAQTRNKNIVDLLLAAGANVESYTHEHKSVLHSLLDESIERPEEKEEVNGIFDKLVKAGAQVTALDKRRQSLLHLAAEHDCKDIFQKLLPEFADYSGITTWGCTAIHTLLCSIDENDGEGKRSKEELDHCSTTALDGDDDDDVTPPAAAADDKKKIEPKSYDELLKDVFEKDQRVAFVKDDEGRLPIHLAAKYKHPKTLELILKNYAKEQTTSSEQQPTSPSKQ